MASSLLIFITLSNMAEAVTTKHFLSLLNIVILVPHPIKVWGVTFTKAVLTWAIGLINSWWRGRPLLNPYNLPPNHYWAIVYFALCFPLSTEPIEMFYSTFYFPMLFWSQRKVLTIPYKASTPFKSLGIMGKSVSDKKKLLQFLVGKRQLSVVIRWAPALVSPINNLLSLSRVSFCREGSLFGTDLEKLPINWLRPHTHTLSGKAIYTRVSHF